MTGVSKCPTRCKYTQFILSVNCSTYCGWFLHQSSGAQVTVFTASGTSQPLLLPVAILEELRLSLISSMTAAGSSNIWPVPDAVNTFICAPDDGWRKRPKLVEQFTDKINCVQLHLVGHLLTYNYNAWSHGHKILRLFVNISSRPVLISFLPQLFFLATIFFKFVASSTFPQPKKQTIITLRWFLLL